MNEHTAPRCTDCGDSGEIVEVDETMQTHLARTTHDCHCGAERKELISMSELKAVADELDNYFGLEYELDDKYVVEELLKRYEQKFFNKVE